MKKIAIYILLIILSTILLSANIEIKAGPLYKRKIPDIDTYIYNKKPDTCYDTESYMYVGHFGDRIYHILMYFDLSSIKEFQECDIEILEARLYLYKFGQGFSDSSSISIGIYRVTKSFYHATWKDAKKGEESWDHEGGDYDSSMYGSFVVEESDRVGIWISSDITSLVRYWYKTGGNKGLLLKVCRGSGWIAVYTRNFGDSSKHPYLLIKYRYKVNIIAPSSITLMRGESKKVTITISGSCPVGSTLHLSAMNLPSGVSATFTPSSFTPSSGGWSKSISLTISASNTASIVSNHPIKIKVTGYGVYEEKTIQLNIVSGDFSMSFNPSTITVAQGGSGSSTLQVSFSGGFTGPVTLSVKSKPSGFTVTFSPSSITPGSSATVTVNVASSVSPGTHTVVIKGTGGGKTATASLLVTVTQVPFNFDLQASPNTLNLNAGQQAVVTITATLVSGTAQPLSLTLSGLPAGTSYNFNPATITPTGSSTLIIDTSNLDGDYTIIVTASGGGVSKQTTIQLHVTKQQPFDFTISVSPSSVEINQGESTTVVITVTKTSGTAKPVTLTLIGLPSGASYSFNPSSVTPTGSSVLTINAGSAKGSYTLLVKGTADGVEKTATFTLTIKEKKCIIATATYGSEVSGEVNLLRRFRDNVVLNSYAGRQFYVAFNAFYYSWSPYVAQIIHENGWLKTPFKIVLYPLIGALLLATNIVQPIIFLNQELAVYLAGTIISILLGIIYIASIISLYIRFDFRGYIRKSIYLSILSLVLCIVVQFLSISILLTILTSIYILLVMMSTSLIIIHNLSKFL